MQSKKILLIDVDGTLVDYSGHIPESAVKAIRQARQQGHRVYICTGRSKAEVYKPIWDIGLDGMIGGNGAYIEDQGTVVSHQMLSLQQTQAIVDWLYARQLEFYLEANSGLYASKQFATRVIPIIELYQANSSGKHKIMNVEEAFPDMLYDHDLYREDVTKVSFILNQYHDYEAAKEHFSHLKVGTWGGKGEHALFGDIALKDVDKAKAILTLVDYLELDMKDTIAFGDASIDIPMFGVCAESCCMGSGGDEAKRAAKYITTDVDKDGLHHAFVHYKLI